MTTLQSNKRVQQASAILFLVSSLIYITAPILLKGLPGHQPSFISEKGVKWVELVSLLTSIASLLTLLSAMMISLGREKRDRQETKLKQRLQEIRINREKIALEQDIVKLEKIRAEKDTP